MYDPCPWTATDGDSTQIALAKVKHTITGRGTFIKDNSSFITLSLVLLESGATQDESFK